MVHHPNKSLEDISAEGPELSDRSNISSEANTNHYPVLVAKNMASLYPHPKNLQEAKLNLWSNFFGGEVFKTA